MHNFWGDVADDTNAQIPYVQDGRGRNVTVESQFLRNVDVRTQQGKVDVIDELTQRVYVVKFVITQGLQNHIDM